MNNSKLPGRRLGRSDEPIATLLIFDGFRAKVEDADSRILEFARVTHRLLEAEA